MSPEHKYNEWRVLTPVLLVTITVLGGAVSFFLMRTLSQIDSKSDRTFQVIAQLREGFYDYRVQAENRFTKIETTIVYLKNNKGTD